MIESDVDFGEEQHDVQHVLLLHRGFELLLSLTEEAQTVITLSYDIKYLEKLSILSKYHLI